MKRYSTSVVTREIQIQTTITFYYTPISMSKKTLVILSGGTNERNRNSCCLPYKTGPLLWKAVWWLPKKLDIHLPYDPVNPLLGGTPKKTMFI
jgi:hypothetical protein